MGTLRVMPGDVSPTVADYPDLYAMVVEGDCLAPRVFHGDYVLCSPSAPLTRGEFVVLYGLTGGSTIKLLVMPPLWFPHRPGDEVEPLIMVEQLNPPRVYEIAASRVHSLHAVVSIMPGNRAQYRDRTVRAAAAGGRP